MSQKELLTPPGRIVCAILLAAALSTAPPTGPGLAASGALATMLLVASGAFRRSLRVLGPVALVSTVATLPLVVMGRPGLAARITARSIVSCTAVYATLASMPLHELEGSLLSLGAPRGLSAAVAGTLRQAARLTAEGRRMLLARSLRGPVRARDGAALLGGLFARATARAERMDLAMALRGYAPERAGRPARFSGGDLPYVGLSLVAGGAVHLVSRAFR